MREGLTVARVAPLLTGREALPYEGRTEPAESGTSFSIRIHYAIIYTSNARWRHSNQAVFESRVVYLLANRVADAVPTGAVETLAVSVGLAGFSAPRSTSTTVIPTPGTAVRCYLLHRLRGALCDGYRNPPAVDVGASNESPDY